MSFWLVNMNDYAGSLLGFSFVGIALVLGSERIAEVYGWYASVLLLWVVWVDLLMRPTL